MTAGYPIGARSGRAGDSADAPETAADRAGAGVLAPVIVWFRQDLRLSDNPALTAAAATGRPVIPLYILDRESAGPWAPGGASRWWLHHSLESLARSLAERGLRLVLRQGAAGPVIEQLIAETGARGVYWNRCYEPWAVRRDGAIEAALNAVGVAVRNFNAALLFEPGTVLSGSGAPYRVFTPFWRACLAADPPAPPLPEPAFGDAAASGRPVRSEPLDSWGLLPTAPDWAGGLRAAWQPGEATAQRLLQAFLANGLHGYAAERDRPDLASVSHLSPHLHFGEIGPRRIWHAVHACSALGDGPADDGPRKFLAEIGWREFCYNLLADFPDLPDEPLQPRFAGFPWADNPAALRAWQRGRTGYPFVDAGMRQLWQTGWMHNRLRMVTASFLVKHLLIPWQAGAAWFWDTLVDADLANNSANWQWVAGCGADAAPYFRIFNPVTQGRKFDPGGDYVRRFVPELAGLPDRWIHRPWDAPPDALGAAGVRLGETYPRPIVGHAEARRKALDAFARVKGR